MAENKNRRFFENDTLITSFVPPDLTDVGQGTLLYEAYQIGRASCRERV